MGSAEVLRGVSPRAPTVIPSAVEGTRRLRLADSPTPRLVPGYMMRGFPPSCRWTALTEK